MRAPIVPRPLSSEAFAPYGRVLMASPRGEPGVVTNLGTALRFDGVADLVSTRGPSAPVAVKVFRCRPVACARRPIALLEKHPCSTQIFVPMNASRFVVLVALGGARPDPATLAAFVAGRAQGVGYGPGVWHHPMIAVDAETDFAVFAHEDGTADDCVIAEPGEDDWPELDLGRIGAPPGPPPG